MAAPASTPRMVGREVELAALLGAFEDRDGRPRVAIVRGEAGIGKTRLVSEFLTAVARRSSDGAPVIAIGQCVDLGPIGTPFGPIRRVLRDLQDAVGMQALREAVESPSDVATLACLLPSLGEPEAEVRSGELAEAIRAVLESLSASQQVVIVIEDLQWADAATLGLLRSLAATVRSERLVIVATYRSDDVDRFHPLRSVLAELERLRSVVRVDIAPLRADEVAEQVGMLSDRDLSADDVRTLVERSGGVPFLVEELVDVGDAELPDTLRDLVLARYGRLSEGTRAVVRTMAAGGVRVDHETLHAVADIDDDLLDAALWEAVDSRVVLGERDGYAFRHALTREAVHAEMLPSERVRVHRRYAEHLAGRELASPDAGSAVAEHWLVARETTQAFDATVRALARSRASFAPATSVTLVERLTELWSQVPDAAQRAGTSLAALHLEAAMSWYRLGEPERGLRAADEGLAVVADEDRLTRVGLLRHRFVHLANSGRDAGTAELDEAIGLLADADEPSARLLLSRILTNFAQARPREKEAREHLRRAISIAREVGDADALAVALTTLSEFIADVEQDEPGALGPLDEALVLDLDPSMRLFVASSRVEMLSRLGRFTEAAEEGRRFHAEAVGAGIEHGNATYLAVTIAHAYFAVGDAETAIRFAQRARRLLDRPGRRPVVRTLATHYAWNDELVERDALFDAERRSFQTREGATPRRGWWTPQAIDAALGAIAGASTRFPAAAEAITSVLGTLEDDDAGPARRYAAVTVALLHRASGDVGAMEVRTRLATETSGWPAKGAAPTIAGYVTAVLLDADGAPARDRAAAWRSVVLSLRDGVMPVRYRFVAQLSLGAALLAAGERAEAQEVLADVSRRARAGGVAAVARWADAVAERAGPAAHDPPGANALESLTARERQVLELVAEGLTNPQIGRRLFISPKTASVHVSAILAKVGATNRAEAAALFAGASAGATDASPDASA